MHIRENQKITLTIGQIRQLIRESLVTEELYEPKYLVGDLNLPDSEIRADLETLGSRKVPNTITHDDTKGVGRLLVIKYMGEDAIRNFGTDDEWFWVEKKELRIAIAIQLRYNRHRKSEFTEKDYIDFLMLFKSLKEPSNTKDFDYALSKEPVEFIEELATSGNQHPSFEDYLRRNFEKQAHQGNVDSIIKVIEPQLKDWHDEFIRRTKEQCARLWDVASEKYRELKAALDAEKQRLRDEHGEHRWEFYKRSDEKYTEAEKSFSKVKWIEMYNGHTDMGERDRFIKEMEDEAEMTYRDHLQRVSEKIMGFDVNIQNLDVTFVSSDYWRTFELGVTDGLHNLYARSIWCAEYSDLVKPHFRFIVTDKKTKMRQFDA